MIGIISIDFRGRTYTHGTNLIINVTMSDNKSVVVGTVVDSSAGKVTLIHTTIVNNPGDAELD